MSSRSQRPRGWAGHCPGDIWQNGTFPRASWVGHWPRQWLEAGPLAPSASFRQSTCPLLPVLPPIVLEEASQADPSGCLCNGARGVSWSVASYPGLLTGRTLGHRSAHRCAGRLPADSWALAQEPLPSPVMTRLWALLSCVPWMAHPSGHALGHSCDVLVSCGLFSSLPPSAF